MTPSSAIRLARALEPYDPLWLEEPVPPEMPEQMALVARATSIPIATGERLATKYEFARVLECRAAAILQMALGRVGGLLEAKKFADSARGLLRGHRAASLCRPSGVGGEPASRGEHAELPHPGEHRAQRRFRRRDPQAAVGLRRRLSPPPRRAWSRSGARRRGERCVTPTAASGSISRPASSRSPTLPASGRLRSRSE